MKPSGRASNPPQLFFAPFARCKFLRIRSGQALRLISESDYSYFVVFVLLSMIISAACANFLTACGKKGRPAGRLYVFFAYFAFFAVKNPLLLGCGFAALGPLWLNLFSALVAALPRSAFCV
jgi:hypothetical protein